MRKLLTATVLAFSLTACSVAQGETLRLYLMGNSLTDNVNYGGLEALAERRGHEHVWGRHSIPGAPIDWIWNHPDGGFRERPFGYYPKAITEFTWDAVTLQPFNRSLQADIEGAGRFMDLAKKKSPDVQFYVYAQWQNGVGLDYTQTWMQDVSDWLKSGGWNHPYSNPERTALYYETLTRRLREAHPDMKPVSMIPVGHVFYLLDQKIKAGAIPGVDSIFQLYANPAEGGGTHVNNVGSYVAGVTFFATLYGESPIGLPYEAYGRQPGPSKYGVSLDENLAGIIQRAAWQVVTSHPLTGVGSDEGVRVASPRLQDAVAGEPYRFELQPGYGKPPYRWSVTDGKLPSSVELEESGAFRGRPEHPGQYAFTVQVTDARDDAAEREFALTVEPDTSPTVPAASLPTVRQAEYFSVPLQAEGGNGPKRWQVIEGKLPTGVKLTTGGILRGAAGKPGSYSFTVAATDFDMEGPETDSREFELNVQPASEDALMVPRVPGRDAVEVDGKLEEKFWNPDTRVEKAVAGGEPDNRVTFDAVWDERELNIAVRVLDSDVRDGDRVEVYLDGLFNREETYNWDDRRIVVLPDGALAREECIGDMNRIAAAAKTTTQGYAVEVSVQFQNLGLSPWRRQMANRVFGLDVMNVDADAGRSGKQILVWRGTAANPTDPRNFGPILLLGKGEEE